MLHPVEQARRYLQSVPGAISKARGHDAAFSVAITLVEGFALSDPDALAVMLDTWNPTCSPHWSEAELRHKIEDARKKIDPAKVGSKLRSGERSAPSYPDTVHQFAAVRGFSLDAMRALDAKAERQEVSFAKRNAEGQDVARVKRRGDNKPITWTDKNTGEAREAKELTIGKGLGVVMPWPLPEGRILITEGIPDTLRALTAGHRAVIGTVGAKSGRPAVGMIQKLCLGREAILCPHPDDAGQYWLEQIGKFLTGAGIPWKFIPATDQDLDDRLKSEVDQCAALEQLKAEAILWVKPKPEKAKGNDEILVLPGGEQSITACAEKLFAHLAATGRYFLRGGRVVTVTCEDTSFVIENVTPEAMRSIPDAYFSTFTWRSDGRGNPVLKPTPMTRDQSAAILECGVRDALPELRGMSGCPLLLADGRVIGPGFDKVSGIYVTGGKAPEKVAVEEAAEALTALLGDFDFVSPGDHSRALAGLITPALRLGRHLRQVPVDVAEADQSQSGKGYRQKLVAALYGEQVQPVAQRAQGGVGSFDESLAARLHTGRPFIQLDNLRGKVDSPYLEAMLTADEAFPVRIPHRGEVMIDQSRFVLMATSNAVEMTPDLANRSTIIRIRKRPEGYPFKRYPEGDVLDLVRARQAYYLGCVFAVVRSWIEAGRPQTEESRHDFRLWVRSLDWIVQNVFHGAPLMDGHKEAKARVSDPSMTFVRVLAVTVDQAGHLGEGKSASELYELAEANGISIPGLREPDERQGPRAVGKILSRFMNGKDAAVIDDFQIMVEIRNVPRTDGNGYFDMKFYRFERTTPRIGRTTVDTVDTVEGTTFLGDDAFSNKVIGSTVVNCGTQNQAHAFLDRLAARGIVIKLDGPRVNFLGRPTEDEMEEYRRLNGAVREVLLEREEQDLFATTGGQS